MTDSASWAEVAVVLITGASAVYVANRQLKAYNEALRDSNKNERFRNSIKVLDDMRKPTELMGTRTSPMDAVIRINTVVRAPSDLSRFKKILAAVRARDETVSDDDRAWFRSVRANSGIVVNFYLDLNDLLSRELVDPLYVIPKVAPFLLQAWRALCDLGDPFSEIEGLKDLVDQVERFRSAASSGATDSPSSDKIEGDPTTEPGAT